MIAALNKTVEQIFSPPFRLILLKSLGLTILLLTALGALLFGLVNWAIGGLLVSWLPSANFFYWVVGLGLVIGLAFLAGPVSAMFAGLFTDEIAAAVERRYYPNDPPGRPMSLSRSLRYAIRFTFVVIGINSLALFVFFIPGVGVGIFFVANGYVLGREYFEVAALRHLSLTDARILRRRHGFEVFLAGLLVAVVMAVPIVNILTPLFATAFYTHIYKRLQRAGV